MTTNFNHTPTNTSIITRKEMKKTDKWERQLTDFPFRLQDVRQLSLQLLNMGSGAIKTFVGISNYTHFGKNLYFNHKAIELLKAEFPPIVKETETFKKVHYHLLTPYQKSLFDNTVMIKKEFKETYIKRMNLKPEFAEMIGLN